MDRIEWFTHISQIITYLLCSFCFSNISVEQILCASLTFLIWYVRADILKKMQIDRLCRIYVLGIGTIICKCELHGKIAIGQDCLGVISKNVTSFLV